MAVSVNRCCGGASIGSTCRPSVRSSASSAARRRIGTLVAVCVLVLASHVPTAGADDAPQPPAMPAMPTIAVQVDVSIPGVSVNVQTGTSPSPCRPRAWTSRRRCRVQAPRRASTSPGRSRSRRQRTTARPAAATAERGTSLQPTQPRRRLRRLERLRRSDLDRFEQRRARCRSGRGPTRRVAHPRLLAATRGDSTTRDRAAEERDAGCRRGAIRCHSSSAASQDASAGHRRGLAGPRGRAASGAHEGQPLAPPTGTAGGSPLPGVSGGLVLRHDAEAEEGMSTRIRP